MQAPNLCPFYGRHAAVEWQILVEQHGNQCALLANSYSPCIQEMLKRPVDWGLCSPTLERIAQSFPRSEAAAMIRLARQIERENLERLPPRPQP